MNNSINENLKIVYQSEFWLGAYGGTRRGFYIDLAGRKYTYYNPETWHDGTSIRKRFLHAEYISDIVISKENLLDNLNNADVQHPIFRLFSRSNSLNDTIINDLVNSPMVDTPGHGKTDSGAVTNSVFVFNYDDLTYKRIILSYYGMEGLINQSTYTKAIIKSFGETRFGARYSSPLCKYLHDVMQ
jgi:hypothetical protein